MYKVLFGDLVFLGFVADNDGIKSVLLKILIFGIIGVGIIGVIGTFYNADDLGAETRRYRALAIIGLIYFLWWAQSQIS